MRQIDFFRLSFISLAMFVTLLLVMAIGSLLVVPEFKDVWQNLWGEEMRFSLKLSMMTGLISTFFVMIFALPIGYTLSPV